jgi:selenide,water dikinase
MPIVDDAEDFGAIAATNAISDIYAMGAEPIVAIAILGWPIDKIPGSIASAVLQGARKVCADAGIALAGGHSIDAPEPIFGLAVTGTVPIHQIKKNKDGLVGDLLYLTKALGIGLVTTAQKKKLASDGDLALAKSSMLTLNNIGMHLASLDYVHAITDVTGFGLAGHLIELCDGGSTSAEIFYDSIPVFEFTEKYISLNCIPGGTIRNWKTYGHRIKLTDDNYHKILADPQTSGGLLMSVDPKHQIDFEEFMKNHHYQIKPIGSLVKQSDEFAINVI